MNYNSESSFSELNVNSSKINNLSGNPVMVRTPLQPKKNNKLINNNMKLTPIKQIDFNELKMKSNKSNHNKETLSLEDNFEINYNMTKCCNDNHYDSKFKENQVIIGDLYNFNDNTVSTIENSPYHHDLFYEKEKIIIGKALDFFEKENLIYLTNSDLKLRENYLQYAEEDLIFHIPEEENN